MARIAKVFIICISSIVATIVLLGCAAVNNYIIKQEASSILKTPKLIDYAKDRKRYF